MRISIRPDEVESMRIVLDCLEHEFGGGAICPSCHRASRSDLVGGPQDVSVDPGVWEYVKRVAGSLEAMIEGGA